MINNQSKVYIFLLFALIVSCEEPFDPPFVGERNEVVVEAYIEYSPDREVPTYVILSRSFPFIGTIDESFASELYIRDAIVTIDDGERKVDLSRICIEDLPQALREELKRVLGVDSFLFNFCLFADVIGALKIEPGREYRLEVEAEGKELHSIATIPRPVPLDSLWASSVPNVDADTLRQLTLRLTDPRGPDFYRYLTSVNDGPLLPPITSVTDDKIFDGQSFDVNILKAEARGTDFDPETFGYFNTGDRVVLKWCTLERNHFRFWETLEYGRNNQGPFSSYTIVESNIRGEGGLGVFGAQSCFYYEISIPEN